jgi:hypothetical protein
MNIFTTHSSQVLRVCNIIVQIKITCQTLCKFFHRMSSVFTSLKYNLIAFTVICIIFSDIYFSTIQF